MTMDNLSGLTNKDTLCRFLDNFRLLHPCAYGNLSNKYLASQARVLCEQLIDLSIKMDKKIFEAGSTPELVNIMRRTVPGVDQSTLLYAPEQDLMLVLDITNLVSGRYHLRKANPGFLKISVSGMESSNNELLHQSDGVTYLSPPLLKSKLLNSLRANQDFSITDKLSFYRIRSIDDNGASIKLKAFRESKGTSFRDSPVYNEVDDINLGEALVDIVPAIKLPDWPQCCSEWITRKRLWPPPSLVEDIVSQGVMVVCKAGVGGDPQTDWRLSFSKAEITLTSNRDRPVRQHALRILKFMIKYISPEDTNL